MLQKITTAISGKKTYIITGLTILYCVLGVVLHFMTIPAALTVIGGLGSVAALRAGVSKAQDTLNIIIEILKLIGQTAPTNTTTTVISTTPVTPVIIEKK